MKSEDLEFLKSLLDRACDLPEAERLSFLRDECKDHPAVLAEAMGLIQFESSDTGGMGVPDQALLPTMAGRKIGPYHLRELLGEGGMGSVYLADQSTPLRRQVAFKVIKLGMDTREVMARFESERQALALMEHPSIARVYDAGATPEGRPYFVMEYIQGVPLNQYCHDQKLDLNQRLELFVQVCRGVEHAHQKGIIHRDLKPGNILVTLVEGIAVPKIIDFGVARATGSHLDGGTRFTLLDQKIGTPEYMSPEQADPSLPDVDTRSDVYSLGVLLYELLTGVLPLERRDILQAGVERAALFVQEEIPKKPSTRIDTETTRFQNNAEKTLFSPIPWSRKVRGDLDWITMKALEKDRNRRYGSASALAQDLIRHRENKAVSAGPPSGTYRLQKFIRRNRLAVTLAAVFLLMLLGLAGWQTYQSQIIARERDRAQANERLANARGLLEEDPTLAVAHALSSLEIMDQPGARQVIREALLKAPLRDDLPRWGQRGNPLSVTHSPDGKWVGVCWSRNTQPTVGIYDLEDYSLRVFTAPEDGDAWQVTFNADATTIIAWGSSGLDAWQVSDGRHLWHHAGVFEGNSSWLHPLDDPKKVAVCNNLLGQATSWYEVDVVTGSLEPLGQSIGKQTDQATHLPDITPGASMILDYSGGEIFLQKTSDLANGKAVPVGKHDASISQVIFTASGSSCVSMDLDGKIKVWDLTSSPAELLREFSEKPGTWNLKTDPRQDRFLTAWGSELVKVHDLDKYPRQLPESLLSSIWWAHDGDFLPDGSLVTTHNGGQCPVAHWRTRSPLSWSLDISEISGSSPQPLVAPDGKTLFLWTTEGEIRAMPLTESPGAKPTTLGHCRGWMRGIWSGFHGDFKHGRVLTYSLYGGHQYLEISSGKTGNITGLENKHLPVCMNQNSRWVGYIDIENPTSFLAMDLDSLKVLARVNLTDPEPHSYLIREDDSLLTLGKDHLLQFNLASTGQEPDTLWTGDAQKGGALLDGGRSFVVADKDLKLYWVDTKTKQAIALGEIPEYGFGETAFNSELGLLAVAGRRKNIQVFDLSSRQRWSLPSASKENQLIMQLFFDPINRWLLVRHIDKIVAWDLPLNPLMGQPPYEALLEEVGNLTNVRVVPDDSQANRFRVTNTSELKD